MLTSRRLDSRLSDRQGGVGGNFPFHHASPNGVAGSWGANGCEGAYRRTGESGEVEVLSEGCDGEVGGPCSANGNGGECVVQAVQIRQNPTQTSLEVTSTSATHTIPRPT